MGVVSIDQPDFYRLGFASQMIVWAMRKRLHLLAQGGSEANVTDVFARAGFTDLHAVLMSIVDVLLCGASNRVQIHGVSCPCLAPHEVGLLNALAYRQQDRASDSRQALEALFCPAAALLVEPAVEAIVDDLNARRLQLTAVQRADQPGGERVIELADPAPRPPPRFATVH